MIFAVAVEECMQELYVVIGSLENSSSSPSRRMETESRIHFLLNGKFNLLQEIVHNKALLDA